MAADATDTTATAAGAQDDDPGRDGGAGGTGTDAGRDAHGGKDDLPEGARKTLEAARKAERAAARRAAEAEAKVKDFEDRGKSEAEKAAERAASLEAESGTLKSENLRLRVAIEKKLPVELIDRLKGSSKEEIEADADALLKLVGGQSTSFDGGTRTPAPAGGMDALIRRAAGR